MNLAKIKIDNTMYRVYRLKGRVVIEADKKYYEVRIEDWNNFINDDFLFEKIKKILVGAESLEDGYDLIQSSVLPPIDRQEIWASGVTYFRSREARKEESTDSGDFYEKVYEADRPELFFKAGAQRTVGHGDRVNIRNDSTWNVPEPELTLFITSNAKIVAYTIGNDMSSRSIEGENPLYLPQAKVYERCAGLGPCLLVTDEPLQSNASISMNILRGSFTAYSDSVTIDQMKRKHDELVEYLFRELEFPYGCYLMTGTGLVPPREFSLKSGDKISITIDSIGTLLNSVN